MIEAKDLRIGNYARIKEHFYEGRITCIDAENGTVKTDVEEFYEPLTFEDIDPIPLTPEILEKAGFKIINHIHGYSFYTLDRDKKQHKGLPSIDIYEHKTTVYGYMVAHCLYVHQLMNLFHALTGKELKITL